jgi:hypothetical protein
MKRTAFPHFPYGCARTQNGALMLVMTYVSGIDQTLEYRLRNRIFGTTVHTNSGVRITLFSAPFRPGPQELCGEKTSQ